jgi:GDP-L-fucose synthase
MTLGRLCVIGGSSFIGKNLEADIKLTRSDCDLLDFESTKQALKKAKPESIINCAAKHGSVREMSHNQVGYLEENIKINMNILKAAHELDINNVLLLGSVSSFPFENKEIITEKDFYLGPVNEVNFGYNSAKRFIVDLAKTHQIDHDRNFKVAHLGNIYGPHMKFSENATLVGNLIYRINKAQTAGSTLELYGHGTDIRALTYVNDLQRILRWFLENESLKIPIIVSSGYEVSIKELASSIAQYMGFCGKILFSGEGNLGQRKVAAGEILTTHFQNLNFTSLEVGLSETVDWFQQEQGRPSSVGRAPLS